MDSGRAKGPALRQGGSSQIGFVGKVDGQFRAVASVGAVVTATFRRMDTTIALAGVVAQRSSPSTPPTDRRSTGDSGAPFSGSTDDYSPCWSPDGNRIVFLSNRGGRPRLWSVLVKGRKAVGNPQPLADVPDASVTILGVGKDGTDPTMGAEDIGGQQAYTGTVNWDDGTVHNVAEITTPPFTGARRAVFSPDAKRVAFLRKDRRYVVRPGWQIPVVKSLDGTAERVYPTSLTLRDEPIWDRDGRGLLFAVNPEGQTGEGGNGIWTFRRLNLINGTYRVVGRATKPGQVRIAGTSATSITYFLNDFATTTGTSSGLM